MESGPCKAKKDDMDLADLKRMTASISDLAKFVFRIDAGMLKLAETWVSSINQGILLKTALKKLDTLGKTTQARMNKDKNCVLLFSVNGFVMKLVQLLGTFPSIDETHSPARKDLMALELVTPFLNSPLMDLFKDCGAFKVAEMKSLLEKACGDIEKSYGGHTGLSWKSNLLATATFAEVAETAEKTIKTLDGTSLRNALIRFEEASLIDETIFGCENPCYVMCTEYTDDGFPVALFTFV